MNLLTIIYLLGVFAVGFITGVTVELFIDAEQIRRLNNHIDKLKLENEALINGKTEVIEIVDNRTTSQDIDFSQNW